MDKQRKPGWAFWTTVVVLLPVLYVASFGPACWVVTRMDLPGAIMNSGYRPVIWAWERSPPTGQQVHLVVRQSWGAGTSLGHVWLFAWIAGCLRVSVTEVANGMNKQQRKPGWLFWMT